MSVIHQGPPAAVEGDPSGTVRVLGDTLSDELEVRLKVRLGDGLLVHRTVSAKVAPVRRAVVREAGS